MYKHGKLSSYKKKRQESIVVRGNQLQSAALDILEHMENQFSLMQLINDFEKIMVSVVKYEEITRR